MISYFSTDALIVYGFLLITLVVGLWAGRDVKTIREYAIANQTYGIGILTMTMLATYLTGSKSIGLVGRAFEDGILPVLPRILCGIIINFYFIARYIAPKIVYFNGCLTLAEIMGKLYGPKVRFCMGILGAIYSISLVTLQIIWISYIGEIISIPTQWGILLGGSFLIIYSVRGGMKSVAMTDAIKFVAIVAFIPIVVSLLFHKVGGIAMLFQKLPSINLDIIHNPHAKDYIVHCIWFLFPAFPLSFPFIQRMLMAKDKKQLVQSYYWNMGILTLVFALLVCIGLAAIVLREMGDTNMPQQGSKVFMYLIKNYFPSGIRGLVSIGLLAAVMATADSFLNAAGLLLAHDVIEPILKKKQQQVNGLKISRYSTFLLGLIAICIALIQPILPHLQYGGIVLGKGVHMGMDFVAAIFTIPMIAGIMGLKTDARSFFISMAATFVAFGIGKLLLPDLWFMPTVIVVNALSFFGAHYVQNQGVRMVQHFETFVAIDTKWRVSARSINVLLSMPLQWAKNFMQAFTSAMPNLYLFAPLTIFSHLVSLLIYTPPDLTNYIWSISINTLGVILCILLLVKDFWPTRLQKHLGAYWLFMLLYCLPFAATANFLLGSGDTKGVVQVILSVTMLIFLVDWTSFFVLAASGMVVACLIYRYGTSYASLAIPYQAQYLLAYALLFLVTFGKLFLRKPAISSTSRDFIISERIKNTFLGEQIALVNNAVQGLSKLIHRYMQHTEEIWMSTRDGFHTLFVNGMQTIEDPDLYQLLVEILPAFQGIENDGKLAMRLLKAAISSRLMASSLELNTVKVCIKNAVFELRVNRSFPHGYICTLYQMVNDFHSKKTELRVVTFAPTQGHLHIRDYSHVISTDKTLPLLKFLSITDSRDLSISNTESFLKSLQQSIADLKQGYKEYTLEFPNLELVA